MAVPFRVLMTYPVGADAFIGPWDMLQVWRDDVGIVPYDLCRAAGALMHKIS